MTVWCEKEGVQRVQSPEDTKRVLVAQSIKDVQRGRKEARYHGIANQENWYLYCFLRGKLRHETKQFNIQNHQDNHAAYEWDLMEPPGWLSNAAGALAMRSDTSFLKKHTKRGGRYTTDTSRENPPSEQERGTPPPRTSSTAVVVLIMVSYVTPGEDTSGNTTNTETGSSSAHEAKLLS